MFYAAFNGGGTHRISPLEIADAQRPIVLFPVIDKAVNHDSLQEVSVTAKIYIRRLNYLLMLRKKQKGLSFPHVPPYGIPYSGIFSGNPEELDTR
jgi:hypothetical protein